MKSLKIVALGAALALSLAACAGDGAGGGETDAAPAAGGDGAKTVGVAMPTQTSERWIADGKAVEDGLKAAGYEVNLQFGNDDIPTQQQQIDQMITKGVDLLIVASIDGTALANQLEAAAEKNIPVIAYDRLINGTENVDFYVTFDNYNVGVQQATSLLVGLGLLAEDGKAAGSATGPFNVELFAGSLDDNNAHFFWKGAIDTLKPYMDEGTIVVKSGQTDIEKAATLRWLQETAQKRMEDLLTSTYSDGSKVDGVLSPYDGISRGIITALQNAGYGPGQDAGLPIVTGQDAEIASIKLINDGVQFSTIFKDTRKLATQAVTAAESFLKGEEPEANDTETYDNKVKIVPSYLLESDIVYAGNIKSLLVDSGYWTDAQVASGQA
ncbi:multiple monosaccharide ABC transporter substrate-binding protein [Cellulomonas chengniuliangii]|uniref:Sugar ABC transporter substrate-binding protein n=1 Tax=Cellulomonas chengniuliangii TaxID=2968084 RepID=A0ABY5KZU9_9CELL|nr:multiple monosaccharide ABC transporter substrate-binding protein [Cellulomonas chengniuliangii]MCC2309506.1 sugar-binding protein [Cellulomonas chengniuliangii]MCC2316777.1 sugar-binding protein [Cellulomonas chengniuliangii]UUI74936.1 sugar ABC transporter substrate-binding protein [Cellulomonas chengniuliangii]